MPKYKSAKFMFKEDPNNKRWAEDKSRLGFKLLEKMGWKEGDGLGKKRDGMTEHVKVAFKTDTAGIGAHEEAKKERTVCQKMSSFSEVLSRLKTTTSQQDSSSSSSSSSDEEESTMKINKEETKTKINRIHHHRRARSKMTSNYSQEDLAAILGKSPLITNEKKSKEKTTNSDSLENQTSSPTKDSTVPENTLASEESEKKRKRKEKKEKKEKKKKIEEEE
ncbi:hypothetical protein FDP41_011462 [Naegleria fowleri]|uniref:PinX1-related protein 1 n=1 Tax=Naegleria fowleri TaxID=5763 RepID=A0A6A5C6Q1_NAEFO|nr:uncharacterized protein FDP41_011462 [Naegleria fowleri]KAF0982532.1 hypothetical protein FDP41_011462 [Naegleria fowleri]CAG4715282.1 unnamed protein product [Naegleria fowleri]